MGHRPVGIPDAVSRPCKDAISPAGWSSFRLEGEAMLPYANRTIAMTTLLASGFTKHDWAGTVVAIFAVAVLIWGGMRMAAKAAGAMLFLVVGGAAIVLAVLFFSRAI